MKWEHCMISFVEGRQSERDVNNRLAQMGNEEWELVSAYAETVSPGGSLDYVELMHFLWFKRPLK
ncbi:hypothetical protein KDL30_15065 [bacterium]|nr:hypothetical protein [bacterium]